MASITKSLGLSGDVVSGMTLPETALTGVVAGVANTMIGRFIPEFIPAPIVNIAEVAGGVALKGAIGGKAGLIAGNALAITGAVGLGQFAASFIMNLIGGNATSGEAETSEPSAIVY